MWDRSSGADAPILMPRAAVLGPFLWAADGTWQPAPTRQVGRIATVLAGWPGQAVGRDRLIGAVWGERPPATAVNTLQVHMSQLRRFVGPQNVASVGDGYRLEVAPPEVDTELFTAQVRNAAAARRRNDDAAAAVLLESALGLWRGTAYPDVSDPELVARRAGLVELADQAREQLVDCRLTLAHDGHDLDLVVAQARELVVLHPERDRGHQVLVRALEASGRSGEAAAARSAATAHGIELSVD